MKKMWSYAADAGLVHVPAGQSRRAARGAAHVPGVSEDARRHRPLRPHRREGIGRQSDLDNLCRLADFEQTYVKTSAFYALGAKKAPYTDLGPMIRKLRDTYGASRLMWASDCPFQVEKGHTYANSIALIRDRLDFLTAEDKQWMLRKTAEKVFFA